MRVAFIRWVYRNRHIGQHRFRACRRNRDETAAIFQRIFEMPEFAVDLARFDFKIRNCGFQAGIPVDETLVAVQQALVVKLNKHLDNGI